ncbi:GATA zinc finger domain-containing protein 7-like [Oppia nitens]|uniref:GATA zinc finger domain-containing protein 7-like n=1 Tax=Oppia nitens TaxID=1686743 RepID=UPI0023DCE5EC|nr:GATA zinc finger domain-containing protein 7-like [Oppia nitens]
MNNTQEEQSSKLIDFNVNNNNNNNKNNDEIDLDLDLFEDISDLNREIEALEELVEYEIRMESMKGSKSETNICQKKLQTKSEDCNSVKKSKDLRKEFTERRNSVQTNGCKSSPPLSFIPRCLPSVKPRKCMSYGNLTTLYATYNKSKPSQWHQNSTKIQNSKSVQKSKTRILSERKKNDVFRNDLTDIKKCVHQKQSKNTIKSKSLIDLSTNYNSGEIQSANSCEQSIDRSNDCDVVVVDNNVVNSECIKQLLTESNQTESSLQSKAITISGTESQSHSSEDSSDQQILKQNDESHRQKLNLIECSANRHTIADDDNHIVVDSNDLKQQHSSQDTSSDDTLCQDLSNQQNQEIKCDEVKEDQSEEQNMNRMTKSRDNNLLATCLPPTYARQPPDGREITLNYMDSKNVNNTNKMSSLSCDYYATTPLIHEDSGVFIETDTPSPELEFTSINKQIGPGLSSIAVTRIKYKLTGDHSDADTGDTGITSMSSDSMDELDSCPSPNYHIKKHILDKNRNPSSDFQSETAMNGQTNGNCKTDKWSEMSISFREKIAMFDNQNQEVIDECDDKENLKNGSSLRNDCSLNNNSFNYELSSFNETNDIKTDGFSSNLLDSTQNKQNFIDKSIDSTHNVFTTKTSFIHKKSSSLSLSSDNTQQNMCSVQYSGHLQPSYVRYSSLGSNTSDSSQQNNTNTTNNTYSGIGVHKPLLNGSLLSSILETRKQNASKLKGLVIPDVPTTTQPAVSKALPTIFSNTTTSSLLMMAKPEEVSTLTTKSQTQSQPNIAANFSLQRQTSLLSEQWADNASIPKYSPAFKRRQLEMPHSLTQLNNVSQDTTDSLTSSFNRSNSMTGQDQQFQFLLSHSKPVIHLMPETAVGSSNIDGTNSTMNTSSLEEQLAQSFSDTYRHSSIQRRYSADVFNYSNSLKYSLEKRPSTDSTTDKTIFNPIMQSSAGNGFNNTIINTNNNYFENTAKPPLIEQKSSPIYSSKNEYLLHKSVLNYNTTKTFSLKPNNDDDSSTKSHKTSEDLFNRVDDSAFDTTSDSMDQTLNQELTHPKVLGTQLTVLKNTLENDNLLVQNDSNSESVKNFKALAEQWEQRSGNEETALKEMDLIDETDSLKTTVPEITSETISPILSDNTSDNLNKTSVSVTSNRSVSDICKVFETNVTDNTSAVKTKSNSNTSLNSLKNLNQNESQNISNIEIEIQKVESSSESEDQNIHPINGNEPNETNEKNKKISEDRLNVWDKETVVGNHKRMSSMDSLASDSGASSSGTAIRSLGQRASSISNLRDSQYGSVSSLASSTSIISPQELQQLIDEANQSLESNDINNHNIQVVVLHREYKSSGSIGITLAGGSDCETKEITVHRVIKGSLTDRDGRIKQGDRILSINGKILKGVTHKEALDIMKSPRPEVVIVLSRLNLNLLSDNGFHSRQSSADLNDSTTGANTYNTFNDEISSMNRDSDNSCETGNYRILRAELHKDVAGLGFILEGGKDSPIGDRPLAIKRIFRGGPADKEGTLVSGDEVLTVNEHSVANMTRTEAWNFLKKLPEGPVILVIRRKKY